MTATTNISLPTVETLVHTHLQDLAMQPASSTLIHLPFHGSCPKCHHLHRGSPFEISTNPNIHRRLRCERCDHQMFGLGRASTQNTLASVDTDTSNTFRCVDVEALNTISERSSVGPSPSTPTAQERSVLQPSNQAANKDSLGHSEAGQSYPASPASRTASPVPRLEGSSTRNIQRSSIRGRIRKRFLQHPRVWNMSHLGIRVSIQPFENGIQGGQKEANKVSANIAAQRSLKHLQGRLEVEDRPNTPCSSASGSLAVERTSSKDSASASRSRSRSNEQIQRGSQTGGIQFEDTTANEDQLRTFRHEITRKRKAAQICTCDENCACRTGTHRQGANMVDCCSSTSRGRQGYRSSTSMSEVSQNSSPQPEPSAIPLEGLGTLFDQSPDSPDQTLRAAISAHHRGGRCAPINFSRSSSPQYFPRPGLLGRSSSTPAVPSSLLPRHEPTMRTLRSQTPARRSG